ncbi:MAG: glutamate:GABA antiporter [Gaiellales bacterium]|nr:glutamate:GABA antiporter [Gaiellales bacterium]
MASVANEPTMASERIAPGMLPRVLGSFDMVVIFVAIVLFVVNASAVQPAGPAAFTYWILGFLLFLIPGALVTAQLGLMFPQEGSLYVWTQKALGPFWGFFAGFCAWWPGVLVMVATADLVVTIWQFVEPGSLSKSWMQLIVILAVLWFSAVMSTLSLRVTQSYANIVVFFYGAAIFVIGLAGVLWLIGGNKAANSFSGVHNWLPHTSNWTFFGLVILALLGIEVPLNFGVEVKDIRAIKRYLIFGSIVVMAAYLIATFGNMVTVPLKGNNSTTGILTAIQTGFWGSHTFAVIVALVIMWFFVSNTVVYNYSFSRLLFVSGLERRLPALFGKVNDRKVPVNAVYAQTAIASIFSIVTFGPWAQNGNFPAQVYLVFQAAVTVIWCLSMVLLFADVFLVRRAFPQRFEEVRVAATPVLYLCGIVGMAASVVGAIVTFKDPWNPAIFTVASWREWLAIVGGVSVLMAIVIYAISEMVHKREAPSPTPTPVA